MQKTKLGITVGLMGAIMCFAGLISGYISALLVAGYILLAEENAWLRKTAVKIVVLMLAFSLLSIAINFSPSLFGVIESILNIFNSYFSFSFVHRLFGAIGNIINVIETVLFVILGVKAFNQGTVKIPVVDALLDKHFN